jgi:hypothetical protein
VPPRPRMDGGRGLCGGVGTGEEEGRDRARMKDMTSEEEAQDHMRKKYRARLSTNYHEKHNHNNLLIHVINTTRHTMR